MSLRVSSLIITGVVCCPAVVLATLLAPLAAYHRVLRHVFVRLEPVLQRLDFSIHGYMMSKPIDNQCKFDFGFNFLTCAFLNYFCDFQHLYHFYFSKWKWKSNLW